MPGRKIRVKGGELEKMSDTSYTVNLPKTAFPMKANSFVREVEFQKRWEEIDVYGKSLEQRKACDKFVLHDGPPYLSSDKIHIGTALNKILKDIVTKYKAQRGFYAPYVPGYDSHGLPIENAVLKSVKGGRAALSIVELRQKCREFALANLEGQEANFKRLGVWGNWKKPYVTLHPQFEAAQIRVFGAMYTAGYLYKGLKSVQWCPTCETALAEAEVEYQDHTSQSIYAKFEVDKSSYDRLPEFLPELSAGEAVSFVIWTTTPWTLPGNMAVCLHPELSYLFMSVPGHGVLVVVDALKDAFLAACGIDSAKVKVLGACPGSQLEHIACRHPFLERLSPIVLGEHVTTEVGTGCVHTAPGHGPEDFEVGRKYELEVVSPVDARGVFNDQGGPFAGRHIKKANMEIVDFLKSTGHILSHSSYQHSYPHCWRCKNPLIFRATEQWFASVSGFRDRALAAIDEVKWHPASGRNRIYNMVEKRSDWCISRQRTWGVPIPVFYCKNCTKPLMTSETIEKIADIFAERGSDAWWELETAELLPEGVVCPCGHSEFEKETDTMDVWFDSGVTHAAVLDQRNDELRGSPCELYLEGSDQHRGWFQSSLLTSVAVKGSAPYKTVLTHGFVVDENGRKMSKSVGNVVEPQEVIKQYGADVLRLWVASVNYTDDVPIGKNMLVQLAEVYRKLRNTARYLLGNLSDFDPSVDTVPYQDLSELDKFILHRLQTLIDDVRRDFDNYEFFKYYQLLQNFCVVDLSSFYFDIVKDRLYTAAPSSQARRGVQTVLNSVLQTLVRLLVPVTPHMAEDIWQHMPEKVKAHECHQESVLLTDFPAARHEFIDYELAERWKSLIEVRYTVNKALEEARAARKIGSSLEARVAISFADGTLGKQVLALGNDLPGFFITSQASVELQEKTLANGALSKVEENGIAVSVYRAEGEKCPRCWKFSVKLGVNPDFKELCPDCAVSLSPL